jgi:hypothetical protein
MAARVETTDGDCAEQLRVPAGHDDRRTLSRLVHFVKHKDGRIIPDATLLDDS